MISSRLRLESIDRDRERSAPSAAARALLLAVACTSIVACERPADRAAPTATAATQPPAAPAREAFVAPDLFDRWVEFDGGRARNTPALRKFYIDGTLGHQVFRMAPRGVPPYIGRQLILDDDELLLSSGRRLWTRELTHQIGLAGQFCFVHSTYCVKRLFDVRFSIDGQPIVVYDNQYAIRRFPSHTTFAYELGAPGSGQPTVSIEEHKFITYDDRAAAIYSARSGDGKDHVLRIEAIAPYPRLPGGGSPAAFPMMGSGRYQNQPIFLYLDAPDFERLDGDIVHLATELTLPASGESVAADLAMRFAIREQPQPERPLPSVLEQASEYNRWFADNIPYFDSSDPAFKKMWYYRWWIVRFNMVDFRDGATGDLRNHAFYEGKLGFDNPIGFAIPAQIKELTYLRDPEYALSQLRNSYANRADNGAVLDPPGSPYWGETYSHWIVQAAAELNRVHPIPQQTLAELLPQMAADVRAWATSYDQDGDALPERARPRVTGYDLDILSWWHWSGARLDQTARPPSMERVDLASFVYANAIGMVELATAAGDEALAAEFATLAAKIRDAATAKLWDPETEFFYPQRAGDDQRAPYRELHGLFAFTTLLAPNQPPYTNALRYLVDPQEFWSRFPPVITSQAHYRDWSWEMDGLTRNIAPHPISMGGRTLIQAVRNYSQDSVRPSHVMELLSRYNDLVYPGVHPNDPTWRPNAHEYYSQWEPYARQPQPKPSDISHDFHSMWLSLVVEGPIGLVPRADDILEIDPMAESWEYFLVDGLRYRGLDLTIVWDAPGDGLPRYDGYPEGLSVFAAGRQIAHRDDLGRIEVALP